MFVEILDETATICQLKVSLGKIVIVSDSFEVEIVLLQSDLKLYYFKKCKCKTNKCNKI